MRLKKTLSAVITAAMLTSMFCSAGAFTASAAEKAATVDGIDASDFSSYTTYDGGDLGANYTADATTFKVWAPTSSDVKLKLYKTGSDSEEGAEDIGTVQMELDKATGVWSVKVNGDLKNTYYTYLVTNEENPDGIEVVDIYAKAAGVNGNRGMVVDLDSTDPDGWENDSFERVDSPTQAQVWEIHVKDFSYDPESGVSDKYRGKYMAFTELETTLNNAGDVKTCMNYLKDLGINYVQINPMYDFGSVDEASGDETQFNWGYDPKNYNVPEGSYSTDPNHGEVRIKEMKEMIQALHENGIGVIMDVVYNHTYSSENSWFNLTVPNYYYRQNSDGSWSNGSGCGNDTASEREMFKNYMVDSVYYWASEYHLDGFRFDLMGLHDSDTMDALREKLDTIDSKIITYGEGWNLSTTTDKKNWAGNKTSLCVQAKSKRVSDRIGFFNDDIRDALKGKAFDDLTSAGFVSGKAGAAGTIYASMIGHQTTTNWAVQRPGQNVVYSCCHDNQTLWDRLVATEYGTAAADSVYDSRNEKFVSGNKLSGAIVMTSQGIPFILAGEEFARTKYGDHNSYRSSPDINMMDWSRTVDYADIVSYYKGLIQLRNAFPGFADNTLETGNAITKLDTPSGIVGIDIPNVVDKSGATWSNLVAYFNGNTEAQNVLLPGAALMGDVDGNGQLTSADALAILRESTGLKVIDDAYKSLADIDGDGKITSNDALKVLRISVDLDEAPKNEGTNEEYTVLVDDQTAGISEIETVNGSVTVAPRSALILVPKAEYDRVTISDNKTASAAYLVVKHVNKNTGDVLAQTTLKGVEGQYYSTQQASDFALEYDFDSVDGAASGKLTKGTTTVTYNYVPYPGGVGTVVVSYTDENGKTLSDTVTTRARAGEHYTTAELGFPWYKLKEVPANAEGEYTGDEIEVKYVYAETDEVVTSTIHVAMGEDTSFTPYLHVWNYYDEETGSKTAGTKWPGEKLEDPDGDGWYEFTFQNGNGYNWILNDNNGSQTADMSNAGDIWVVATGAAAKVEVFDHNPFEDSAKDDDTEKGTVVVKHVDENGNEIVAAKTTTRPVGEEYTTMALENDWYKLDETQLPENANGKYTDGTTEVVYHYTSVPTTQATVHVKLADDAAFVPHLYFWGTKNEPAWPGVEMTDADNDGWYEVELTTGGEYNWILNDGDGKQSKDMTAEGDIWVLASSVSKLSVSDTNPDL